MPDYKDEMQRAQKAMNNFNAVVRGIDEDNRRANESAAKRAKLSIDSDRAIIEAAKVLNVMNDVMQAEGGKRNKAEKRALKLNVIGIVIMALTLAAAVIGILATKNLL